MFKYKWYHINVVLTATNINNLSNCWLKKYKYICMPINGGINKQLQTFDKQNFIEAL